eukprot:GHVT01049891.1.p1 GENE.GHVT01049891.1~~GHVT01049891.1.p1  ORF type:complete len:394 (-),score=84.00 GHVT01049891.1:722-1759(-)
MATVVDWRANFSVTDEAKGSSLTSKPFSWMRCSSAADLQEPLQATNRPMSAASFSSHGNRGQAADFTGLPDATAATALGRTQKRRLFFSHAAEGDQGANTSAKRGRQDHCEASEPKDAAGCCPIVMLSKEAKETLRQRLRTLRGQVAAEAGIKNASSIVSLVGLEKVAEALPLDLSQLAKLEIHGFNTDTKVRRYGGAFVQGVHTYLRECGFGAILPSAPAAAPLASSDKPQHSQRSLQPHYENLTNDATGSSSSSSIEHLQGYSYQQASSFAGLRNMDNTHMQLQPGGMSRAPAIACLSSFEYCPKSDDQVQGRGAQSSSSSSCLESEEDRAFALILKEDDVGW